MEETKRNPLQRFYGRGDLHFITFSCYRRRPYLGTSHARNCFIEILDEVRSRQGFSWIGYVVMPGHVHLLIGEPTQGDPSKVLQVLKQKVSRSLRAPENSVRKQSKFSVDAKSAAAPLFWQPRFYDFNVWSEKKLKEKLRSMHRNPVDQKVVYHPKDVPRSSWRFYAKAETGPLRIDLLNPSAREVQSLDP